MSTKVKTVKCPSCGRPWTGHFPADDDSAEATCKDCKAAQQAVEQQKK